jgi:hypothetical protein
LICVVCKVVLSMATSAEAARKALMCNHCKQNAWNTIRKYATGNATVEHLGQCKVAKGYMFSEEVINLFAQNMGRLVDFGSFQKWWSTNTIGQELDPAYPSIRAFVDRVTASYNKVAIERHNSEMSATAHQRNVTEADVTDLALDMAAHDPNASSAKRDCKALAAERLAFTIKRMRLDCTPTPEAIGALATEIEASPNDNVDRLAANFMKRLLDTMTDEERAKIKARPAKAPTKKSRSEKAPEAAHSTRELDAPARPHTADVVVHGDPTKIEIVEPAKPEEEVLVIEDEKEDGGDEA